MRTRIPESEFSEIVRLYLSGQSLCQLQEKYHIDRRSIRKILVYCDVPIRDHSHQKRKYTLNENYFDVLDTPNKAYILGLLYADGCNYTPQNRIKLELQEQDKDILLQINAELGTNKPLTKQELHKKNPNWKDSYRLSIINKHMSETLNNWGMIQNKSLVLTFPDFLEEELLPHFIRGYFDGDGHIEWSYSKFLTVASSLEFCESLQQYCERVLHISSSIYPTYNKESNTKVLHIFGKENIYLFLKHLYDNSSLHIDRKYNLFKKIEQEMIKQSLLK